MPRMYGENLPAAPLVPAVPSVPNRGVPGTGGIGGRRPSRGIDSYASNAIAIGHARRARCGLGIGKRDSSGSAWPRGGLRRDSETRTSVEQTELGAASARLHPDHIRHLRQMIVVPTPSCERISNSSIRRLAPGRPIPMPREVL